MLESITADVEAGQYGMDERLSNLSSKISPDNQALLDDGIQRLSQLCEEARRQRVALLFDAEQSYRQAAVHMFVWELMKQFNTRPLEHPMGLQHGPPTLVYDTMHMYLRSKVSVGYRLCVRFLRIAESMLLPVYRQALTQLQHFACHCCLKIC